MPTSDPGAGHRLRGVLEAHRLINSDLSLDTVLSRIVRSACDLVGSQVGALGVVDEDANLERLVHHGVDDDTLRRVSATPTARGLRWALVGDLAAVSGRHEERATREYLTVPIRARDEVFGDLYVARPNAGAFDDEDEELLTALAGTAATAIGNARLYEDAQRTRDWLHASGEIARGLLADHDRDLLADVASRTLHVARADYGALIVPTDDGRELRIVVPAGVGAEEFDGYTFSAEVSEIGRCVAAGESMLVPDVSLHTTSERVHDYDYGSCMLAPLVDSKGVRGALILVRQRHRSGFTPRDLELATMFADQVALALELNDVRAHAEALSLLEMRNRIAQDMHDNLIQRLFATGMGLQVLAEQVEPQDVAARMHRHIDELDETIDQVRERVFGLRELPADAARRDSTRIVYVAGAPDLSA